MLILQALVSVLLISNPRFLQRDCLMQLLQLFVSFVHLRILVCKLGRHFLHFYSALISIHCGQLFLSINLLCRLAHYLFKLKLESHTVGFKLMYRCLQSLNLIVGRRNLKLQRRYLGCQSNHVTIQSFLVLAKQANCVLVSDFLLESVVSTAVELDFQSFVTTSDVVHLALEFFALDTPLIILHAFKTILVPSSSTSHLIQLAVASTLRTPIVGSDMWSLFSASRPHEQKDGTFLPTSVFPLNFQLFAAPASESFLRAL
ncbi:hypothetical protein PsorP6_017524 [Peronosclerospora sorghi]|uniref:Uncharacterized protein n=1 Tax=Peronosclerospora sorghi TaxID=230839 RepID=A0ACC0WML9_9STRA|nr:hypothetical protein PsorP6_017524 [Peronosclerospora sorghi]